MDLSGFEGKRVLVTGATGAIGSTVVRLLSEYNRNATTPITVMALVRNLDKAKRVLADYAATTEFLIGDVCAVVPENKNIHYIIHGASITSSKDFVDRPVDTVLTALEGTRAILELARANPLEGLVYLSSMEVYGNPMTDEPIDEHHATDIDPMEVRSGYPESKRLCENLCAAYASQYGVPAMVARLTQTFGGALDPNDNRVYAQFARAAMQGQDIILRTKGDTKRDYCYVEDAARAILTILLRGKTAEAYNVANEETYCSIHDMACLVAANCGRKESRVILDLAEDLNTFGYLPTRKIHLDTRKLQALGWTPQVNLQEMFDRAIAATKPD